MCTSYDYDPNIRFANQDGDAPTPYSISNFQQIFQEVKAENPTASMGAVGGHATNDHATIV